MTLHVVFSHGYESGPHGDKILAMRKIALRHGAKTLSVDYTGSIDLKPSLSDPGPRWVAADLTLPEHANWRVQKLVAAVPSRLRREGHTLVLVGFSMGGYVSAVASAKLRPHGLFLLAPAFYRDMLPEPDPAPCLADCSYPNQALLVHGWNDDVVPVENSVRYAKKYGCTLYLLRAGHRFPPPIPDVMDLFDRYLAGFKNHD